MKIVSRRDAETQREQKQVLNGFLGASVPRCLGGKTFLVCSYRIYQHPGFVVIRRTDLDDPTACRFDTPIVLTLYQRVSPCVECVGC